MDGRPADRRILRVLVSTFALMSTLGALPSQAAAIRWTLSGYSTWGGGPHVSEISGIIPDGGTFEGFEPRVVNEWNTNVEFPPNQVELRDGRPYEFRTIDSGVTIGVSFSAPDGGPLGDGVMPWLTLSGPLSGGYGRYVGGSLGMTGGVHGQIETRSVRRAFYPENRPWIDLEVDPDRPPSLEELSRFVEGTPIPVDVLDAFLRATYRFDGHVAGGSSNTLAITLDAMVRPRRGDSVVVPEARTLAGFAVLLLGLLLRRRAGLA